MGVPDHNCVARAVEAAERECTIKFVQCLSKDLRPGGRTRMEVGVLLQIMRDDLEDQVPVRPAFRVVSELQELFKEFIRRSQVEITGQEQCPAQAARIVHERMAGGFLVPSIGCIAQMSQQEPAIETRRSGAPPEQVGQRVLRSGGPFHAVGREARFRREVQ